MPSEGDTYQTATKIVKPAAASVSSLYSLMPAENIPKIRIDSDLKNVLTEEKAVLIREMIISKSRWGAEVLEKEGVMIFTPCGEEELAIISAMPFEERFIECDYYVRFKPRRKRSCDFSQLVLDNPEGISIFDTIRPCP